MKSLAEECAVAWNRARDELGIRVRAPYKVTIGSVPRLFAAYLPDFGSPTGCYLYPVRTLGQATEWRQVLAWAQGEQRYVSFIRAEEYVTFDRGRFVEALKDWGYFGEKTFRPIWLGGCE